MPTTQKEEPKQMIHLDLPWRGGHTRLHLRFGSRWLCIALTPGSRVPRVVEGGRFTDRVDWLSWHPARGKDGKWTE